MKRVLYAVPVLIFFVLAYFLFGSLKGPPPSTLPSVWLNKPAPAITLPALDAQATGYATSDLAKGDVIVVNVLASWCPPCWVEAPVLAKMAKMPGITLYGFFWKDTPEKARAFLNEAGNPFTRIGIDVDGSQGMEWGVTAPPETFIIDGKGIVRARFVGAITEEILRDDVLPAIEKARANM